ncbi:MAG: rhomboid family intramembrane serine protease [Bdellovibrionales bacterium]
MNQGPQFQAVVPFKGAVKGLVIANVAVWLGLVLIPGLFMHNSMFVDLFGLVPERVITSFWIWQVFTYMFMHASGVFHILFNMLILWWFGAELEGRWGNKFFLTYYLVCGVGAGIIYLLGTTLYAYISGNVTGMITPLVGASGATFGLLLAYGLLFGERVIYFMMLFPMKAKYFTMIIGGVELVTMMDGSSGTQTANLAHLGGLVVGFVFLTFVARYRAGKSSGPSKRGRKLKLVVDNEREQDRKPTSDQQGPKYWN